MKKRLRVLVAEDDSLTRDLVRARLNGAGYITHTARCGRETLSQALAVRPHLLLLDIGLPTLNGFQVLEALQADFSELRVPTIMLTARRSAQDVSNALRLGAVDYLVKQEIYARLFPRVARALRLHSLQ